MFPSLPPRAGWTFSRPRPALAPDQVVTERLDQDPRKPDGDLPVFWSTSVPTHRLTDIPADALKAIESVAGPVVDVEMFSAGYNARSLPASMPPAAPSS